MATDLYNTIYDDVVTLTNRPDLAGETAVAVRTATISVHNSAAYPRDVETVPIKLPNPAYIVGIDAQVSLPRLRGISQIVGLDVDYNVIESLAIDVVELGDTKDPEYGTWKNNIAYLAGTAVNIRCSMPVYGFVIDYFMTPQVRPELYSSWIAMLMPDPIVYMAASIVLSTNGNEDKAKSYMAFYQNVLKPQLDSSYLTSIIR